MPKRPEKKIAASEFKARCLALLDKVARDREALTVTKHGRPVARIVPIPETRPSSMLGSVLDERDLIAPTGERWDADR